jgi:hypothetical protein
VILGIAGEIRGWSGKPKELVTFLTEKIASNDALFPELIEVLKSGSKVEKGTCADVLKHVSAVKPELLVPYIDDLIAYINYDLPRVKWGIPEAIGNLSVQYPAEAEKAIPKLLINTKDESTVVRWCAAFALSEIAKNSTSARVILVPKMQEIAKEEGNSGVKNVYLKALKKISK